jgi:hypothetical protein
MPQNYAARRSLLAERRIITALCLSFVFGEGIAFRSPGKSIQEDKIMLRRLLCWLAISTPVLAGRIDSGTIITNGLGEPSTWNANISSASGNYSVTFSPFAATTLSCVLCPIILPGDVVTVSSIESAADFGSGGQATIGGIVYPTLIFDAAGLGINSVMTLSTSFIAGVPGTYLVPFTMTGVLQAATVADPGFFVLNDPVSGYGYAQVSLSGNPETLNTTITWTFVPEPMTVSLVGLGLALILGARVQRSRH